MQMFLVSIITGIITDSFGELRSALDSAKEYQATTNFITGIPFSTVPNEKSTSFLQYTYLMLYLQLRKESDLTPLERMVRDKIREGSVDWLPDGRCISKERKEASEPALREQLATLRKDVRAELRVDMKAEFDALRAELKDNKLARTAQA